MEKKFTPHTEHRVTVYLDGEERVFVLRKITLRILSWHKQLMQLYCDHNDIPADGAINHLDIIPWICEDEQLINDTMREAYDGDHTDVDWFDMPADATVTMLGFFLLQLIERMNSKTTASNRSSSTTHISSSARANPGSNGAAASSVTSRQPGPSPDPRRTTTTS